MEYYSTTEKKEILPLATTWMKLKGILLSNVSQRERQIMYGITSVWNLKENKSQFHRNGE